jgi:hypothetical protein
MAGVIHLMGGNSKEALEEGVRGWGTRDSRFKIQDSESLTPRADSKFKIQDSESLTSNP